MIAVVQPLADAVSVLLWGALTIVATVLTRRVTADRRSAWTMVAACCGVVALDKAVDVQTALYVLGKRTVWALDPYLHLREHRAWVRIVLVVPALTFVVLGSLRLARSRSAWGRAERLAQVGLALVLVYVGLRLLPGMSHLVGSASDQVLELLALVLIASGERIAWKRAPTA